MENPPSNMNKLNKSSIKFIEDEDEHQLAKSSRIYNDDDIKNNILVLNNFNLNKNEVKKSDLTWIILDINVNMIVPKW